LILARRLSIPQRQTKKLLNKVTGLRAAMWAVLRLRPLPDFPQEAPVDIHGGF